MNGTSRSQWSSPISYILVMIGAIVGLGNIIQFPYFVTQYGGLFVLLYLLCEIVISIPLLFAELMVGRIGRQNPVGSIEMAAMESNANPAWRMIGWLSVIVSFCTLVYYLVQAAFPLSYFFGSIHALSTYGIDEPIEVIIKSTTITGFFSLETCFILFLLGTMIVTWRGINRGLEMISWIAVPLFFMILFILAAYVTWQHGFMNSLSGLVGIHDHQSIIHVLLIAMGFALFKLNVGMGSMIVYGSYLPYNITFARSTLWIILFDILTSLLSFLIIYPLISENSLNNLTNHHVIYVFSQIPGGILIAALFLLATIMAAWTSTIAMAETVAITFIERLGWKRHRATTVLGVSTLLVGSLMALMYTKWLPFMMFDQVSIQAFIGEIIDDMLMPFSALLIALFASFVVNRTVSSRGLNFQPAIYSVWRTLLRLSPVFILIILMSGSR